jgi:hypothetical protein
MNCWALSPFVMSGLVHWLDMIGLLVVFCNSDIIKAQNNISRHQNKLVNFLLIVLLPLGE